MYYSRVVSKKLVFGKFVFLALVLVSLVVTPVAMAQEAVNPDNSGQYKFKRLKEKVTLMLKFSPNAKADYLTTLLNRRLSELQYIIEGDKMFYFEKATLRYATTAGQLTEEITQHNLSQKIQSTKELFQNHIPEIEQLKLNYDFNTAEWRFVEDDINYLKTYSDQLSSMGQ